MPTRASILADLKSKGKENTRKIYARHGMPADRVYGVSVADLKLIAKTIKGQQALALELYASGIMDAMYLAGMVAAGWSTYSGLVALKPDAALDLKEIQSLLETIVEKIHTAPNRVRYTMNSFVISVGSYVKPLEKQAKAAAKKIGEVSVDMGDTACKIPLATAYIEKVEAAGKLGQKRKTIRC